MNVQWPGAWDRLYFASVVVLDVRVAAIAPEEVEMAVAAAGLDVVAQ